MKKTLCIDIMTTFITKVEISDIMELDKLSNETDFKRNYIMIHKQCETSSVSNLESNDSKVDSMQIPSSYQIDPKNACCRRA
jgi:hypothetical protein